MPQASNKSQAVLSLNDKERKNMLNIARESAIFYLSTNRMLNNKSIRFNYFKKLDLIFDVGVAFWKNGELRGSKITEDKPLINGIIEATTNALRDFRFKPLVLDELSETRIEITVILKNNIEICKKNIKKSEILYNKAYVMTYCNKKYFFLPEIFNLIHFNNLESFLIRLATEKAGFKFFDLYNSPLTIETKDVLDFIDSFDFKKAIELEGPVKQVKKISLLKIKEKLSAAADWLIRAQESDGNIIPVIYVQTGGKKQIDWTRLILACLSLYKYGVSTNNHACIVSAQKTYEYVKSYFKKEDFKLKFDPIFLAYIGQVSIAFDDSSMVSECAKMISIEVDDHKIDPITTQQIATFFCQLSVKDSTYFGLAIKYSDIGKNIYESSVASKKAIQPAFFMELIHSFFQLYNITKKKYYFDYAKKVLDWVLKHQMNNGAIRIKTRSEFSNTRSTGKFIEVLSLFLEHREISAYDNNRYKMAIKKILDWMFSMQYDEENTYFVSPELRKTILGGIRHTHLDSNIWFDSISHLLLGISRLNLENEKIFDYEEPVQTILPLSDPKFLNDELGRDNFKGKLFFGKSFYWETRIYKMLWNFFSRFPKLKISLFESNWGNSNHLIRNYSYLLEYLSEEKIISKFNIANALTQKKFNGYPEFYETYITNKNCFGRGFNLNWQRCLGQSLGEFLERFGHLFDSDKKFVFASKKEMVERKLAFINPQKFLAFSEKQKEKYPERKWNENSPLNWEKCERVSTGGKTFIPTQLVYFGYKLKQSESKLRESNTSGLGGWFSKEGAILSGLYEIIQRDAFFDYWLNLKTPIGINLPNIKDTDFQKKYLDIIPDKINVYSLFLDSAIGIPVILTIIEDSSGKGPLYSLGAGCDPNMMKSLERSHEEAWSIYYNLRTKCVGKFDELPSEFEPFITPLNIASRLSVWGNQKMQGKIDFLVKGEEKSFSDFSNDYPQKFTDEKDELKFAVEKMENLGKGWEVYVHLSESKILKKVRFHSARVIVPNLIPMYYSEENAPIYHPRLRDRKNINTLPHLFP